MTPTSPVPALEAACLVHAATLDNPAAARRALARLAAQTLSAPADALSCHAALRDSTPAGTWVAEQAALRQLIELPALPDDLVAAINRNTATLADAITATGFCGLINAPRIRGALMSLAKLLEKRAGQPTTVRASLPRINAILGNLGPGDFALSAASWGSGLKPPEFPESLDIKSLGARDVCEEDIEGGNFPYNAPLRECQRP